MPRLQLILLVIIIILGGVFGGVLYRNKHQAPVVEMCPTDVMNCPDGSTVPRSGPNCEFGICKQELPSYMEPLESEVATTSTSTTQVSPVSTNNTQSPVATPKKTVVKKVTDSVASVIKKVEIIFTNEPKKETVAVQQTTQTSKQTPTSEKNALFNETRYTVKNGSIVDDKGNIIYTFPPTSTNATGWTTHVVNVVPTNSIAAIINSIPIVGAPGQFYLSENSLGNVEKCEFTNKVYILDTKTGSKVLMYEENSNTVGANIARSCTSELYLLATEGEKLILKSHTVGTGTTCESTWSEPDQTWYLDVTKLDKGLRRYIISATLYYKTEAEEKACRTQYESTSTPVDTLGG
jgi:hypothetical protein